MQAIKCKKQALARSLARSRVEAGVRGHGRGRQITNLENTILRWSRAEGGQQEEEDEEDGGGETGAGEGGKEGEMCASQK